MLRAVRSKSPVRQVRYTGLTDASGNWTVAFAPPFLTEPHVTAELIGADTQTSFRLTSVTASGFSLHVFRRTSLTILGLQVPTFAVTNVAAQVCRALAIAAS